MKSSKGHLHILCEKYIFVQDQRNANIKIMSNSAAITGRRSRGFTEEWFLCSYGTISYQCSRSWWQRCDASISHHIWSFGFQTHVRVLKTSNWSTDPLLIIHYCTALQRWQHSLLHQKIFITNCTKSNPTGPAESKLFRTNWIQTVQHERAGCENFLCFSPPPQESVFSEFQHLHWGGMELAFDTPLIQHCMGILFTHPLWYIWPANNVVFLWKQIFDTI